MTFLRSVCGDRPFWIAALLCWLIVGMPHAVRAADGFAPETFTLPNGLMVVVLPDHRAPVVTHMVWYRVGSGDEPRGSSGIAHFLEHLMFRGTKTIPPGEFSKIVARNGGQDNAFTTSDYTGYFQRVAVDRLPLVMELEADRMRNLQLTDAIVATERRVILEERRTRTDNNPSALLSEQMMAALYLNSPYGVPVIGWAHEMAKLSREDALGFYQRYYAPNNAILIVAGDVTAASVRPLAEKYYGVLASGPTITRSRASEPPPLAPRRVQLTDARATLPFFTRYYLVPSYATAKPGEAVALDVMSDVLGGGATSLLYRRLVVERALATSAGSYYSSDGLGDTYMAVYARPKPGVTLEEIEAAVDQVLGEFISAGPDAADVARSKENLVAQAVFARDNQQSMAQIFGVALTTGQTVEDVVDWPKRIARVKPAEVRAAAGAYLKLERSVTGTLFPAAKSGAPATPPPDNLSSGGSVQ